MTLTIDAPTIVRTEQVPLVERGDGEDADRYLVTFEDAGVSVILSGAQLDGLVSRSLAAKLLDPDEEADRD